jgi:hypothetical protein
MAIEDTYGTRNPHATAKCRRGLSFDGGVIRVAIMNDSIDPDEAKLAQAFAAGIVEGSKLTWIDEARAAWDPVLLGDPRFPDAAKAIARFDLRWTLGMRTVPGLPRSNQHRQRIGGRQGIARGPAAHRHSPI